MEIDDKMVEEITNAIKTMRNLSVKRREELETIRRAIEHMRERT